MNSLKKSQFFLKRAVSTSMRTNSSVGNLLRTTQWQSIIDVTHLSVWTSTKDSICNNTMRWNIICTSIYELSPNSKQKHSILKELTK